MSRIIAPITGRYRTKPIEVEAIRWTGEDNCKDVFAFLGLEHTGDEHHTIDVNSGGKWQQASPGDWIIHDDGFYEVFTDTAFRAEFEAANTPVAFSWGESISTTNAGNTVDIPVHHGGSYIGDVHMPLAEAVVLRDMLDGLVSEAQQQVAGHE